MSWHCPVVGLGGPVGDHDLVRDRSAPLDTFFRTAHCTARAEATVQLTTELTTAFDEK
jgi:hypothetical protein